MQSTIFIDRRDAAEQLAKKLERWKAETTKESIEPDKVSTNIVVLAIPRGGVVIGDVIASILGSRLDIVVSRKIGAPSNPELAIGAVMPDGSVYTNENIVNHLSVPQGYIDSQSKAEVIEIERRLYRFRGNIEYEESLRGKTVVLVDDGIATGATILAAAKWLRSKNLCKKLVIAAPVAPPSDSTLESLKNLADEVVILYSPEPFYAVGQFYKKFPQVSDDEVIEIMQKFGYTGKGKEAT
jgi:putative phosphoribosyl transferase